MSSTDMKELYKDDAGALMMLDGVEEVMINAKLSQLESLNSEIRFNGCSTVSDVIELINADIVLLNKMKIEKGIK